MDFLNIAKWLFALGAVLIVIAGLIYLLGRFGINGLPGDISFEGKNFKFYFPIVTCLVLSLILSLILRLFSK